MRTLFFFLFLGLTITYSACEKQVSLQTKMAAVDSTAITVTSNVKQPIKLGIDGTLLHWRSYLKDSLAQIAVGDMATHFIRTTVLNGFQKEEGTFNTAVFGSILEMINAMKAVNPEIKFFGSPGSLKAVYTDEEKVEVWGHVDNVPFCPYPAWIQEWDSVGTKTMPDGTVVPIWEKGAFHIDKLTQHYAAYLNFMNTEGVDITYLDASNEQTIITPAHCKYLMDSLPAKLDPGVNMPNIVAPSRWSIQGGINWLNDVDLSNNEQDGFQIASIHNTGGSGSLEEFANAAHTLEKEAWNTEMHRWTGTNLRNQILNSSVFWEHMQAGINGLATWLFFGPVGGAGGSPMIWSHWNNGTVIKTGTYEIYKQVVNNANGGNYVEVNSPSEQLSTAAFIKDDVLSVWVLNKENVDIPGQTVNLGTRNVLGKDIDVKIWKESLPNAGTDTTFTAMNAHDFTFDIDGESLYFFKIDLN